MPTNPETLIDDVRAEGLPFPFADALTTDDLLVPGTEVQRLLPDGRVLALSPLTFGAFRLSVELKHGRSPEEPSCASWDDQWDYETVWQAVAAMAQWEPATEAEPAGWYRHPSSGRRRPGGDPAQEQVRP